MRALVATLMVSLAALRGLAEIRAVEPGETAVRAAIAKSLPLLEQSARGSMEYSKQCFNCHNQGLPLLTMRLAHDRGFPMNAEHVQEQLTFTANFLAKNKERYREGKGQGGQVDMAGYALWVLAAGDWKADETTAAVSEYLLLYQQDKDHWESVSRRPPSEQSAFTTTYLAVRGLKHFGLPDQQERIAKRFQQASEWLEKTEPKETEDRVFRLRGLHLLQAKSSLVAEAAKDLMAGQRSDGGWSQLDELESDAYATGTVLVALQEAGGISPRDEAYRKGMEYLLSTQKKDGSWQVKSRSKPFQAYFETGYPHGKDQFISGAAGSWATMALLLSLPPAR